MKFIHSIIFYVIMDEPIITFGSESLILEMFPDTTPAPTEPIPDTIIVPTPEPIPEPKPKTIWCVIS